MMGRNARMSLTIYMNLMYGSKNTISVLIFKSMKVPFKSQKQEKG